MFDSKLRLLDQHFHNAVHTYVNIIYSHCVSFHPGVLYVIYYHIEIYMIPTLLLNDFFLNLIF